MWMNGFARRRCGALWALHMFLSILWARALLRRVSILRRFRGTRRQFLDCHPERSEGSVSPGAQILRCAQDDKRAERREDRYSLPISSLTFPKSAAILYIYKLMKTDPH